MLRKGSWVVFSLFPVLSFAAIFGAHDVPVWRLLLSAGVPVAIVDGIRSNWWLIFVGLVAAHYCFFIVHPLFNQALLSWKAKCAWVASNLMFYPFIPLIYVWFCTGNPDQPNNAFKRRRARRARP